MELLDGLGGLGRLLVFDKGDARANQFPRVRTFLLQHVHIFHLFPNGERSKNEMRGSGSGLNTCFLYVDGVKGRGGPVHKQPLRNETKS